MAKRVVTESGLRLAAELRGAELASPARRLPHDRLSGTLVIKEQPQS